MNQQKIKIRDFFKLLLSYKWPIAIIIVMCLGFSISLSVFMQKKYKSQFEINVYSKYFQNPLISEIVPGLYNIPEMRFTIDSMVKEAISDEYIDGLAEKYNFYKLGLPEAELAKKRQELRDRFKYFSTGGQSYRVSFEDSDPNRAKKVAEQTLEKVKGHFINSRVQTIETVKTIMLDRLQSLSASQKLGAGGGEKALASRSPEVLNAELNKIEASISALSKQFNQNHPKIQDLISKKQTIKNWLKEFQADLGGAPADMDEGAFAMPNDKEINGAITGKFFSKYHDFNIALDIEKKSLESYFGVIERPQYPTGAIWPKKRLFAILGFLMGVLFAFMYVFIKEVLAPSRYELILQESNELGAAYLGAFNPTAVKEGLDIKALAEFNATVAAR